jgi:hypothetical protein
MSALVQNYAVPHEHTLCGLSFQCRSTTETAKSCGALGTALASIFPLVFRAAGHWEECQIVTASATVDFRALGIHVGSTRNRRGRNRTWLFCPSCGKQTFKLYLPPQCRLFACRACHNLTYTSVQKHDARLDWLLKLPDRILMDLMEQSSNTTWALLANRAGFVRLGLIRKY